MAEPRLIDHGTVGPDPPDGILILNGDALERKLESLRKTTPLRTEEVPFLSKDGGGMRLRQQRWAVIFGRIETREQLRPPSGNYSSPYWGNGYGQMNIAPAQIVSKQENEFYFPNEVPAK